MVVLGAKPLRARCEKPWSPMRFNERELAFFGSLYDNGIDKEGYLQFKDKLRDACVARSPPILRCFRFWRAQRACVNKVAVVR